MRVVFMGTPAFAVPSLRELADHHDVALVLTRQDRASGRGSAARPSPVKRFALDRGLTVVQPASLTGAATEEILRSRPDVICVAAYGMLLPAETLLAAPHGAINVHASLLPAYRGAAPIQRAILNGDSEAGISIMRMEEGLDTGPYAVQESVPIDGRYADEVQDDLAEIGARALIETLDSIETGAVRWTPQDESRVTYAPKIAKDDVALRPEITAEDAFRRVRASTRRAPARACIGERELTVARAVPVRLPDDARITAGAVCLVDGCPVLGLSDGGLQLDRVRPAGKQDMTGAEWARGARLTGDACWRCTR